MITVLKHSKSYCCHFSVSAKISNRFVVVVIPILVAVLVPEAQLFLKLLPHFKAQHPQSH